MDPAIRAGVDRTLGGIKDTADATAAATSRALGGPGLPGSPTSEERRAALDTLKSATVLNTPADVLPRERGRGVAFSLESPLFVAKHPPHPPAQTTFTLPPPPTAHPHHPTQGGHGSYSNKIPRREKTVTHVHTPKHQDLYDLGLVGHRAPAPPPSDSLSGSQPKHNTAAPEKKHFFTLSDEYVFYSNTRMYRHQLTQ